MDKTEKTPLWVFLAFSSIEKRKSALLLIAASLLFTLYCIPWSVYFTDQAWIAQTFRIADWSWVAMMLPISGWYLLSLRWMDRNKGWPDHDKA